MPYVYKWKMQPLVIPPGFLTTKQAAAALGLTVTCILKKMDRGEIPDATVPGSHKRFVTEKALRRYARQQGIELKEMA